MGQQKFSRDQAELRADLDSIVAKGFTAEQVTAVIEGILYHDLADKNYQISEKPLTEAADKQKEANRIINNYAITLARIAGDKKSGKETSEKTIYKLEIIVMAAKVALLTLGFENDYINAVLGLTGAGKK